MQKTLDGNFLQFKWTAVKNNVASDKSGRAIFDKVLIATVLSPGQPKSSFSVEVYRKFHDGKERRGFHYETYRREIEDFLRDENHNDLQGTPIDKWPLIEVDMAATLKSMRIYTIEALAEAGDSALANLGMGARKLQAQARAFLESAKGNAPISELSAKNVALEQEIERLKKQVDDLARPDDNDKKLTLSKAK